MSLPTRRAAVTAAAAFGLAGAGRATARRIVSLNPCLDAVLLSVADPSQVAALSHYSRQPLASSVGPAASRFPFTYESAEEVIALSPDLVLASRHSSLATRNSLKRLGVAVELFSTPDSVAESLEQVLRIADLTGHPERGRLEIARIEAALAAAAPPAASNPVRALVFQRNGLASGPHTLMDELLRRTGFRNAAVEYGAKRTTDVPLDSVLANPPDVLFSGETLPGAPTWGERVMKHPALKALGGRTRIVSFPEHLMYCGGPNLVESATRLAQARRSLA
ncbi:MAG TPA: ABC transporter substrate-binding protein [Phenylobacterium sp.]|uniref:ABC transporter substrate-binding protein n=1 Tax=Phenylobacterium sp. TaxID=1871053 RepID=UPI002B46721E|nr:ABC transporter substrate-binding protein [Phenylobacterium sp.]HKR89257.1 ABC transporter substrate-binding protein [Phenylobacterium sp.]